MKLLTFAASSSRNSVNRALVGHAAARLQSEFLPNVQVEDLDLNDYEMPIFSVDRQQETGILEHAQRFFDKIGSADGLLISYAEHNGSYTAAFKNIFDWASRIDSKVFQGKPVVALSTSPGGGGGASVLKAAVNSAPFYGADLVGSMSVPSFYVNFDADRKQLSHAGLAENLGAILEGFARRLRVPADRELAS